MNPKTRPETVVIIGGSAAGMSAASKAKRMNPDLRVVALEKSDFVSYSACGIPYFVSGQVQQPSDLVAMTPEDFRVKRGIEAVTQHQVVDIHSTKRQLTAIELGAGREYELTYDKLVLAVGGTHLVPPIPGLPNEDIFTIQTLDDGIRIRNYIEEHKPKSALIVGAGYIGLEMAEALKLRGLDVVIVEKLDLILPGFEPEVSEIVAACLARFHISVHVSSELQEISRGKDSRFEILLFDQTKLNADLILVCAGQMPNAELAKVAGVQAGSLGGIVTDWKMQTNVPNIYAAGDCVEVKNLVSGKPDYVPLGTTANKQGRVAGENIGGGTGRFRGVLGTAVFKLFNLEIARTGLGMTKASEAGFSPEKITIEAPSKADYWKESSRILLSLIVDKRSKRPLGAQMVGLDGVSKRIDVFATALLNRMTLDEMLSLDLSYAPPFAPVWDPVLVAVNAARAKLR